MESARFVKAEDQLKTANPVSRSESLDITPLLGTWMNTNKESRGITRVVLTSNGGMLMVRVFAGGDGSPTDWGEVEAEAVYAASINSKEAAAFTASYDLDSAESHLEANMSIGLLIVASLNRPKDRAGQSNHFSREFYHR